MKIGKIFVDPENSIKGRPGVFFKSFLLFYFFIIYVFHRATELPREAIWTQIASRGGSVSVLLRKTIATCDDFPGVGSGTG